MEHRREQAEAEVAIVGAGPAGTAAATTLARAGVDCLLIDKAAFPRDKCCGDGLTTGALRLLEGLGLDPRSAPSFMPVSELAFRAPSGRTAHVPLPAAPGIYGAVIRRVELDAALLEMARAAGARVRLERAVRSVELLGAPPGPAPPAPAPPQRAALRRRRADPSAARLCIGLEDGATVRARYVIAADGAWSAVRRAASPAERRRTNGGHEWHAFRTYASDVGPEASQRMWVWFERSLLPGYAWSFPLPDGCANVGIFLRRGAGVRGPQLAAAWQALLDSPFMRSLLGRRANIEPARSWPIPAGIDASSLHSFGGRALYVGDAACCADPFTGEGVAQALQSGGAAAEAILSGGRSGPGAVGDTYRQRMARTLVRDHAVARACAALMATPLGAGAAVTLTGATPWTRSSSARWLFEDWPRGMLLSPWQWPTLRQARAGPFAGARGQVVEPADKEAERVLAQRG